MNQSEDGANIVIIDTLEKFEVTWTLIPVLFASGPNWEPPGRISFQAFFAVIWALISALRVVVPPENKIIATKWVSFRDLLMALFFSRKMWNG